MKSKSWLIIVLLIILGALAGLALLFFASLSDSSPSAMTAPSEEEESAIKGAEAPPSPPPPAPAMRRTAPDPVGSGAPEPDKTTLTPGAAVGEEAIPTKKFSEVEVFYATDRQRTTIAAADQRYGISRNNESAHLEYGKAIVTIPESHVAGQVERPKWWKLEFKEVPEKHVILLEPELMEESTFYRSIHDASTTRPANELLMFIHGFNVAWGDAMRRTGQISYDIGFGGVTFCYSWPSQGSLDKYPVDKENSEWTVPHLTKVLADLQTKSQVGKIHIIAHSMGTRALAYAIANAKDEGIQLNLNNVILAAPDMDRDIFKEQILPKLAPNTKRLTMYSSSEDTALKISASFNGSPRLGLSGTGIFVINQMDTVDASGIDTSLLGHSYYGSQKVVVKDIFGVIIKDLLPPARNLKPGSVGEWNLPAIIE